MLEFLGNRGISLKYRANKQKLVFCSFATPSNLRSLIYASGWLKRKIQHRSPLMQLNLFGSLTLSLTYTMVLFPPTSSTQSAARMTQFCLIQGPRVGFESSVSIVWGFLFVSSGRKCRRERGHQKEREGPREGKPRRNSATADLGFHRRNDGLRVVC